jgi:molybdopterin-guanine dinucleotide biosynthesis protein A
MAQIRKPRLIETEGEDRIDQPDMPFATGDIPEALTQAFAGAGEAARQAIETGRTFQEEATAFYQQRLQSNSEAATQFLKCRTWPEMLDTQQAWAKTAADQYSAYLNRMFSLMQASVARNFDKK